MNMDWDKLKQQIKTDPRKTVRFVVGLSITLLLLWGTVLMQSETGGGSGYVNMDELKLSVAEGDVESEQRSTSSPEEEAGLTGSGFWIVLLLAGTGVGLYGYVVRKKNKNDNQASQQSLKKLALLESIELPADQTMSIVKVCNEYWVVGSGSQGMNLLKVLKNDEWSDLDVPSYPDNKPVKNGFMNLFDSVRNAEFSSTNGSGSGT